MSLLRVSFLLVVLFYTLFAYAEGGGDITELDYEIWDLMDSTVKHWAEGMTWYDVLELPEDASSADISKSYRKHSLVFHPDKNPSEKAAKMFQTLGAIAKILRSPDSRKRYHFWLDNGIPYWRGRGYYFRKSENLTIVQSLLVALGGFSFMQYIAFWVKYLQVKSGLKILSRIRDGAGTGSPSTPPRSDSPGVSKKKAKKQNRGAPDDSSAGLFDDANMKRAIDYLIRDRGLNPELVLDSREWRRYVEEEFKGNTWDAYQLRWPNPFSTALFSFPLWILVLARNSIIGTKAPTVDEDTKTE